MKSSPAELAAFYREHLRDTLLRFWIPRSIDREYGGYFNCYSNVGKELLSDKKFTWSQGRFVWIFSELSSMQSTFSPAQRKEFLQYARMGADFLCRNAFLDGTPRCTFLMDRTGKSIPFDDTGIEDYSIFADCFVLGGLCRYAIASADREYFLTAQRIYDSVVGRIRSGLYHTLPYPRPQGCRMHSILMIWLNLASEMYHGALAFGLDHSRYERDMILCYRDILDHFVDDEHVLREIITEDNTFIDNYLGSYINPGHTMEDIWFILHAAHALGDHSVDARCIRIMKNALRLGWDERYGGFFLYAHHRGGPPSGSTQGIENEPLLNTVRSCHDNKVWWVHSEALYALLLCYAVSRDEYFGDLYDQVHGYVFGTFPNPDADIGEWIQIRRRDGSPTDQVVALPVKDPYHIIRNCCLIIGLLEYRGQKFMK